jgi:hypothetical protein
VPVKTFALNKFPYPEKVKRKMVQAVVGQGGAIIWGVKPKPSIASSEGKGHPG